MRFAALSLGRSGGGRSDALRALQWLWGTGTVAAEGTETQIVVAGAGYAGLHIAQRLGGWLQRHREVALTLVDRNDYHQLITELPRVATGTREEDDTLIPLERVLSELVTFRRTDITAFRPAERVIETAEGATVPYDYLVIALGSAPNDFDIPGLAERVLYPYTSEGAHAVWEAVNAAARAAAGADAEEQRRLLTVVIGGGGATGVELAGGFAEELPGLAREHGAPAELSQVVLVEAGSTILPGTSPGLIERAHGILEQLGVEVRTNAAIVRVTDRGLVLRSGETIEGGAFIWAGGVKAPPLLAGSGLPVGHNDRLKVEPTLQVLDHPRVFAAGDTALVFDPESGRPLSPLAQLALEEGTTVARNLRAAIEGRPLEPFSFANKGFVVSVGSRRGAAEIAGLTIGGRLAAMLKDAIEWEYRNSVKHLRGWGAA